MLRSDEPIALPYHEAVDYDDALGLDMDQATGDVGSFVIPFQCEVYQAGCVVTEVCAGATTTPVVKFDLRPTAGSDADRGDGDVAELKLLTTAAGKVLIDEVYKNEILTPGQEVMVEITTKAEGSPTGHIMPFLLVKYMPEVIENLSDVSETT